MSFTSNETPSPNSDIPLINLTVDPHSHWSNWNEKSPTELFTSIAEEETKQLKKEQDKERLTMFFMDSIDGEGSDLSGEEVFDCFKSGISSAYDYAKKEYDKFRYLAEKVGIELSIDKTD